MKKVVIHKAGSFDQLKIEEHPSPVPKAREVKVQVYGVGINYADVVVRWGLYKSAKEFVGWPITPGFEVSGIVSEVGEEVTSFSKGQKVFGVTFFNGYSTEICIPENQLYLLPNNIDIYKAAGIPAVFLTAYHAIYQNVVIYPGSKAIVHSAAGGVGSALLQLCKKLDIETIGVVGASHKVDRAKELGANHVIDKSNCDLWQGIKQIYPNGADVIFDANGGKSLRKGFDSLARSGKMIAYGTHTILPKKSGRVNYLKLIHAFLTEPRFHYLKMDTKSIITFNLSFLFDRVDLLKEAMGDLLPWFIYGSIQPLDATYYDFENVAQAHKDLQSGQTMGKLILRIMRSQS